MSDRSSIFDDFGPAEKKPGSEAQARRDNLEAKRLGFRQMSREERARIEHALAQTRSKTGIFRK